MNHVKQSPQCITGEQSPLQSSSASEFPVNVPVQLTQPGGKVNRLSSPLQHCEYKEHGNTELRKKKQTNMQLIVFPKGIRSYIVNGNKIKNKSIEVKYINL